MATAATRTIHTPAQMRLSAAVRRCRCVRSAHRRRAVLPLMHRLSLNRPSPLLPSATIIFCVPPWSQRHMVHVTLCSVTDARTRTATRLNQIVAACCAIIFVVATASSTACSRLCYGCGCCRRFALCRQHQQPRHKQQYECAAVFNPLRSRYCCRCRWRQQEVT